MRVEKAANLVSMAQNALVSAIAQLGDYKSKQLELEQRMAAQVKTNSPVKSSVQKLEEASELHRGEKASRRELVRLYQSVDGTHRWHDFIHARIHIRSLTSAQSCEGRLCQREAFAIDATAVPRRY